MPEAGDLQHHYIQRTSLPYFPNDSVTAKEVAIVAGSNILTSQRGFLERRNGFGFYEADASFTFSGTLKRFFAWRRWTGASVTLSGAYLLMFNDTAAGASRVWKQHVGTDVYPALIHTDATSSNPFDFVVSNDYVFFGNGVDMKKWDGTTVTNWGITAPSAAVTLTSGAGSLSPVIGYQWVITFGSSASLHMSSPSPIMTLTTGTSRQFTISGNTTTDTQVDQVYIFRTTDGGSIYFEHPSSPISYATWIASGFQDNTADTLLTSKVAPLQNQNNRPAAAMGPVWFANRIWVATNDTLYYSDYEELVRGIEEEAFASTNFRFFGREITSLSVAGQYLLVFTSDAIYRIYGDSLATFRMDTLAENKGCLNRACVARFSIENNQNSPLTSGVVAWLDTSNTVWMTNGDSLIEISFPIRSDIASIAHSTAAMAYYGTGNARWLILMDGGAGKLYVFDLDTKQWMPPWEVSTINALQSVETAAGTAKLFLGQAGVPLAQNTAYLDGLGSYTASLTTNLFDLVETGNPSEYGIADHIELETNAVTITTVSYLTDEDTTNATWQVATTAIDPPHRTQGTNLVEKWYPIISDPNNRGARRMALKLDWVEANSSFKLYGMALAYKPIDN